MSPTPERLDTKENGRPVVSVIVPTAYGDRTPRLRSALASIWAQEGLGEGFDLEAIVVDDASTGPTEDVVRCFPGTQYVRFDENQGLPAARNAGLRAATGERLIAYRQNNAAAPVTFGPGAEVVVSWDPGAARLLPEESS